MLAQYNIQGEGSSTVLIQPKGVSTVCLKSLPRFCEHCRRFFTHKAMLILLSNANVKQGIYVYGAHICFALTHNIRSLLTCRWPKERKMPVTHAGPAHPGVRATAVAAHRPPEAPMVAMLPHCRATVTTCVCWQRLCSVTTEAGQQQHLELML